jgi:hypothetical protein
VCGSAAAEFFRKLLRGKYNARFYRCGVCAHVQSETPYWLGETYANLSFRLDVGMVERSVNTARFTLSLAQLKGVSPEAVCIDYGAGTGLLVRYCRDHGMNFFYSDRYSKNIFALGFEAPAPKECAVDIVTAYEVAEHFEKPVEEFAKIFAYEPKFVLISTTLHHGEGEDWWYFLEDGQHIALYTRASLAVIADKFGYYLASNGTDLHLFSKMPITDSDVRKIKRRAKCYTKKYRQTHGSKTPLDHAHLLEKQPY